jgi:hypothetical protein
VRRDTTGRKNLYQASGHQNYVSQKSLDQNQDNEENGESEVDDQD